MFKKLLELIDSLTSSLNALGIVNDNVGELLTKLKQTVLELNKTHIDTSEINEAFVINKLSELHKGEHKEIIDILLKEWNIEGMMSKEVFEKELKEKLHISEDISIEDHFNTIEIDIKNIKRSNLLKEVIKLFENEAQRITFDDRSEEEKEKIEKKVLDWKKLFEIEEGQSINGLEDEIKKSLKSTLIQVFSDFFVENEEVIKKKEEEKARLEEEKSKAEENKKPNKIKKSFETPRIFVNAFNSHVQKIFSENQDETNILQELTKLFKPTEDVSNYNELRSAIVKIQLMFAGEMSNNIAPLPIVIKNIMDAKEIPHMITYEIDSNIEEDENLNEPSTNN